MTELTFTLDPHGKTPMYAQIAGYIVEEIRAGRLREGEKLPSKNGLCAHLGVSRSTAEGAYAILVAEGYVVAKARSGYYVGDYEPPVRAAGGLLSAAGGFPSAAGGLLSAAGGSLSAAAEADEALFSTGAVDTSVFPFASWAKINKEVVTGGAALLQRGHPQGDLCLREALCGFLHAYRGVNCAPAQIVLGSGMDYLLGLLIELLPPRTVFALEDPGYRAAYRAIERAGRAYVPCALDSAGMRVDVLAQTGAQVAYVTPSHQFPTGITMPAGRRAALLSWASDAPDRYIVEDDYDSEFRHLTRPIPAMQGLDEGGHVVYVGTFSRSLAPSIRIAYLVLPARLLKTYRALFYASASSVSRFEQHTLCRFIAEGFYGRHLRRVGNLYKQKRALLLMQLGQIPGLQISGAEAGLHFLVTLPRLSEQALVARAAAQGIALNGLSQYAHARACPASTVVVGYAGMTDAQILDACARLVAAWTSQ
ncbi:MAG: PLP-dependent aminotransferase family protein [Clostridia bacterium]